MKKNKKDKYLTYRVLKIVKNDKYLWRPEYRKPKQKSWNSLYVLIEDTDYLIPTEYSYKFGALRRIIKDMCFRETLNQKFEVFEEIEIRKIKITK